MSEIPKSKIFKRADTFLRQQNRDDWISSQNTATRQVTKVSFSDREFQDFSRQDTLKEQCDDDLYQTQTSFNHKPQNSFIRKNILLSMKTSSTNYKSNKMIKVPEVKRACSTLRTSDSQRPSLDNYIPRATFYKPDIRSLSRPTRRTHSNTDIKTKTNFIIDYCQSRP